MKYLPNDNNAASIVDAANRKYTYTACELYKREIKELPTLLDPILPQKGLVALAGSSDTGKSALLRQFGMELVAGRKDFLGFTFKTRHQSVIFLSTEDDDNSTAFLIYKQANDMFKPEDLDGLRFVFDSSDLLENLEKELTRKPADCVIVDAFADVFYGDMNMASKVRPFLERFNHLALRHDCLFLFLHHTGKKTDFNSPSKHNLLGSQGFEAKMRMVAELRRDPEEPSLRHLCIVKGNYLREEHKESSYVLSFDGNMRFTNTGERVSFEALQGNSPEDDREIFELAVKARRKGMTVTQCYEYVHSQGKRVGRSKIGGLLKGIPRGKPNGKECSEEE